MKLRKSVLITAAAVVLVAIVVIVIVMRSRPPRHRVFRRVVAVPVKGIPPLEQWSDAFSRLPPSDLAKLLAQIEASHPDLYAKWSLAYLHARALIEDNETKAAAAKLAPFLAPGNPFRDLIIV